MSSGKQRLRGSIALRLQPIKRFNFPCSEAPPDVSACGLGRGRPVGPVADPDQENRHPLIGIVRGYDWRAGQVASPAFRRVAGNKEHHMRMPMLAGVA